MAFPGASADREDAAYVLVGAPLDRSASFRPGARFGPDRVRRFARTFDDSDRRTGRRFSELAVHDAGDLGAGTDAGEYLAVLAGDLGDAVDAGAVPLVVGGEHTVTVAGIRATDPDVVVCLDAHLDLRAEHGGDPYSHATTLRHAIEVADELVVLGARTGSPGEYDRADADDVRVVAPEAVPDWSPRYAADADVYCSVDVDAADPGFAPGTGTPEPFGLAPREMRTVVRQVAPDAVGFDVVEVTDHDDGQAASLAGKLLREFVYTHAAAVD